HGGEPGPQHGVDVGARVGDLRGDGPQHCGEQVAEFTAVAGAATVDLRVHAGYQHDRPEQCLVAAEHRGELPDGGFDQAGRVKPEPVGRVTEDPVISLYPGHAVLVDGEEQGVLAWRAVVDRPWRDLRALAHRGNGETLVAGLFEQADAGVQDPGPRAAAAFLPWRP